MYFEIVDNIINPISNHLQVLYGYLLKNKFPNNLKPMVIGFVKKYAQQYPYKNLNSTKYNDEWVKVVNDLKEIQISDNINVS